ncbi:MAG: porin family protein [Opitutales bacterium]|nr:porin family protein [Opitutales bacterium]
MKKYLLSLIVLFAGITTLPAAEENRYELGFSAGYLFDSEESFIAAAFTGKLSGDDSVRHFIESEVGYMSQSENVMGVSSRLTIVPVFLNYMIRSRLSEQMDLYFAGGIGGSTVSVSGSGFGISISDSDWVLSAQAKAGLDMRMNDALSFRLGVRYIYLSEVTLLNTRLSDLDDFGLEAGLRIQF